MAAKRDQSPLLIEAMIDQQRALARDEAKLAATMVTFAGVRRGLDEDRIAEIESGGSAAGYRAAEFAADEIGLALRRSTWSVQRTAAMTRRVQHQLPNVWDAWCAGDVDQEKVRRIDRGLRALVREDSMHILDQTVLDVAICKSPELLGRWVNRLVARLEPGEHDSRHTLALSDRYASIRPDIDGVSFLSAAMSAMDANAIDRTLDACALACGAADPRTTQQRRADALVTLLLGRTTTVDAGTEVDTEADVGAGEQRENPDPVGNLETDWDLPAATFRPDRFPWSKKPSKSRPPRRRPDPLPPLANLARTATANDARESTSG